MKLNNNFYSIINIQFSYIPYSINFFFIIIISKYIKNIFNEVYNIINISYLNINNFLTSDYNIKKFFENLSIIFFS